MGKENKFGIDRNDPDLAEMRAGGICMAGLFSKLDAETQAKVKALENELYAVAEKHALGDLTLGAVMIFIDRVITAE